MKESITKFDLESAFKALDEIEIPKADKVRANKPALTEIFSRKSKFDVLMEEYYDIGDKTGLEDAKEAREAEVAQAKLARIEKIVDLDAESAEDLLTSYVGKLIIQCPQCMTLFYKNQEDVVASEEDPSTVNVNEICQHCGNESGYSLIGKVGEAEPETEAPAEEETVDTELDLDAEGTEATEENTEESSEEDLNFDDELEAFDLDSLEDEEASKEEKENKEESFSTHAGESLVEDIQEDKDLDAKLEAHNEYIEYLRTAIAQAEEDLEKTDNAQVKEAIQRRIDAFKADLENALPEAVKNDEADVEEAAEESAETKETPTEESTTETEKVTESLTEALQEDSDISDAEFDQLMNSSEFKKPISDTAVRAMLAMEDEKEPNPDSDKKPEKNFTEGIFDSKETKQKNYAELVKQVYGQDINVVVNEAILNSVDLIEEVADKFNDDGDNSKTLALGVIKLIDSAKQTINKTPHSLIKNIISIGQKYERESLKLAELNNFIHNIGKLQTVTKDGHKAMEFLFDKLNPMLIKKLDLTITVLKREFGIVESLDTVFNDVEELQESALESMISDSLVELYGNVAGFRLKDCSYENSKFMVEGVIHFTSGNTRKTTYTFNEALVESNKVTLRGLNEKLGNDKQFFISGYTENKTFITESFKTAKN